jgi:hypothetical protein
MPQLILYHDYSRQEVQDIFNPEAKFTSGAGTWGLHGIVRLPNRRHDYVFFVTFGQRQADHEFDEGIASEIENGRQIHSGYSFKAQAADRSPTWDGKQVNLNRLSDTLPELPLL